MTANSTKKEKKEKDKGFFASLFHRSCFIHLVLAGVFLVLSLILGFGWLKIYTNHGQKLVLPDYEKKALAEVLEDAENESFDIVVTDSIHDLDYPGGIVYSQNPDPQSLVKENRKIYVTVTKYNPDLIPLDALPNLYGNIYTSMRELIRGFGLETKILDYKFDTGPENSILEVKYKGETIINREGKKPNYSLEKGGTLEFILAKSSGGLTAVPNLRCSEYSTAVFLADSYRLILQVVDNEEFALENYEGTYVTRQIPAADDMGKLLMNDTIKIYLARSKPSDCSEGFIPEGEF